MIGIKLKNHSTNLVMHLWLRNTEPEPFTAAGLDPCRPSIKNIGKVGGCDCREVAGREALGSRCDSPKIKPQEFNIRSTSKFCEYKSENR